MSCKFNAKKCIGCPKYNGCLLQSNYSTNLNILDSLKIIMQVQQSLLAEINEMKQNQKTIREDSMILTSSIDNLTNEKVDSLREDISSMSKKLSTLIDSYEIVS